MSAKDTYQQVLIEACHIAGDESLLAKLLRKPVPMVLDWLLGSKSVPVPVFLACVDIVMASNKRHVKNTETFLDEVRRRNGLPARPNT